MSKADHIFKANTRFGPFQINRFFKIDNGIEYYDATQTESKTQIVLRVLQEKKGEDPGSSNNELVQMFQYESEALGRINNVNIIKALSSGEIDGIHYCALEYYTRQSVASHLSESSFSLFALRSIFNAMAGSIYYLHEFGIVHCELTQESFNIASNGEVKLTDIGVSRQTDETITISTRTDGIPFQDTAYQAPEVALGQPATACSDIYSLGVIFIELITGRILQKKSLANRSNQQVENAWLPKWMLSYLPVELLSILAKMIHTDPKDRLPNLKIFIEDLGKAPMTEYMDKFNEYLDAKFILEKGPIDSQQISNLESCLNALRLKHYDPLAGNIVLQLALTLQLGRRKNNLDKKGNFITIKISDQNLKKATELYRLAKHRGVLPTPKQATPKKEKKEKKKKSKKKVPTSYTWIFQFLPFVAIALITPFYIATIIPEVDLKELNLKKLKNALNQPVTPKNIDMNYDFSKISLPKFNIGDSYTYRKQTFQIANKKTSNNKFSYKVTKKNRDGTYFLLSESGQRINVHSNPILPVIRITDASNKVIQTNKIEGSINHFFPLKTQNKLNVNIVEYSNGTKISYLYNCLALSPRVVKVPAGSFRTMHIMCKKEGEVNIYNFYYSPRTNTNVLVEIAPPRSKRPTVRQELVSYQMN